MICQKGPKVITLRSQYEFLLSRGTNDAEFVIPFDGLMGIRDLINISADVIPKQENIVLNISTNELTLAFTTHIMTSSAFAVVLSGESFVGSFSAQQVVSVQIEVAQDDFVHQIQVLLLTGTRPNTQVVQMQSPSHISIEKHLTFGMKSESDDLQSLFSVDEDTGAVATSSHVTLGKDVLAKDYSFNITKTANNESQDVAIVNVLVVRDHAIVTVEEGYTGDLFSLELSSRAFSISLKDSYPGITMGSESVLLYTPRDYQSDEILTKVELDVESVNVDDSAQTTLTFTLRINDTNDKRPIFSTARTDVFIPAESPSGSIIAVVSAVDPDTVGMVTYSLHGTYSSKFQVDKSGVITALHSLKRSDFGDTFPLEVMASDGINDSKDNILVQVSLYTLQKNIKKDLNLTFVAEVTEHDPIGTLVLNVSTQAANYSDFNFQYPSTNLPFYLNSSTGIVSINRDIDREEFYLGIENLEIVGFHKTDKSNPVKIGKLLVTIIDKNDHLPTFSENEYEGEVEEEDESLTPVVVNIKLWDEDIGPNANLTISSNDSTFNIYYNDDQVIITPKTPLDREDVSRYVMELMAVDNPINGEPPLTGSAIVVIRVTDINDNDPVFVNESTVLFITENASPGQLTRFSATDEDEGVNGDISFTLLSGGLGFFDLKDTGELSTTEEVDREEVDQFDLVVRASDRGLYNTRRVHDITLTVYVRDVNDNPPKFDNRVNVFKRFENVSSLNVSVKAFDPDADVNGTFRYMLNHSRFSIDETTGAVALTSELDFESETKYNLTVSAVDNGADSLSSETTVIILVMDVNDNKPDFLNIIVENTLDASDLHQDQIVMHVEVADADSGRNAEVNLSISSPNNKWLKFKSGSSGFLQLSRTDISAGTYDINITATDNGNPPLSSSKSVELVVHNNLTGQSNVQLMTISLPEGNYSGEIVGSVSEAIDGNQTTYRVSSSSSDVFVVNETSGEITCTGTVDRETKTQYLLLVNMSYTEGGVEMTRRVLVILNILDGNDNFPQFVGGSVQWNVIPENAINNTFVQALSVTDLDSGQNGVAGLHYSIINTNTPFAVDSTTGDLTTRWELDRETQDSYLVRVQVRDGGTPPKSATANITISLIDVNDNSPSFTQNLYVFKVTENTTVGTPVSEKISASDPDFAQNGTVSFVIDTDPNICPFSIETERHNLSSTGVLKLNAQLDFETTSTYQCNVSAVDDTGCVDGCPYQRRTNATIRIVVLDINDEKPVFHGAPYTANVTREAGPGSVITDAISATDKDTDYGNNNVSYKILVYQEFFTINGSTGVLTVGGNLKQLQEDTVQIQVVASDNPAEDQPLSATTSIEIVIVDTNNRPWFQNGPYTVDITEEEITSAPWDYRALDTIDKKNVTCNCTYTIIPSEFSTYFTINEAGLVSQVQAIDREKTGSSIYLEVNATDSEIPRKSVTAGLYIRVKDTDDNQPYFTQSLFEFSVNETIAVGSVIGRLDAVDDDEGDNAVIVYSAIAMDTRLTLEKNGTIKVREKLLAKNESKENITFAVTVKKDSKSTDVAEVRITINPYDPNIAPSFDKGTDVITLRSEYVFPVSRGTIDAEFVIPLNGLMGDRDLINVSANVIPKQENIILQMSTNELTLVFTTHIMTSSAFAVVLSGESFVGSFSVQQVVSVQIEVAEDDFVHQIQVLLLSGTRPNTQMVQMQSPSHISIEKHLTFGMKSESDDLQSLFSVDEDTGAVATSSHVTLGKDVLAKDYSFNVTKTEKYGSQKTVALVSVLVVKDDTIVTVEEGYTGDLFSLDLSLGVFSITLKDPYPGIEVGNESVLLNTPRDYQRDETLTKVELDVQYVGTEDSAQTTLTFTLRINDTNDKRPIFSTARTDVFIPAESPSGSIIVVVSAVDPDTVGMVTYSLHGTYSSKFRVDKSGVITALHSLKRSDFGDNFTLEVMASDGINDSEDNFLVQVSLYTLQNTIEDLNFTFMANVTEHDLIGELVLNVSAKAANYSNFNFQYPSTDLPFYLNSSTGIVSINRDIDREEFHYWIENLEIVGFHKTDKCNPVKIGKLLVTIIDKNDNNPTFSENEYEGEVEEEDESLTPVVVNIELWDEDIGQNANLTISSNDSTFNTYYNDDQVIITPKEPLDRENVSRYVMELIAVDNPINGEPPLTGSAIVVIRVTDINDNDPVFEDPPTELFITENASPRQLTRFRATDEDEGVHGDIMFILFTGGLGFFHLKDTGELSTTKKVDREEVDHFDLVVRASDKGFYDTRRFHDITVTVSVNDVNDNPPKFDTPGNVYERFENVSSLNASVKAYDPDNGANGTFRYSLNHPKFSINETTGAVALTSELDYESDTKYNLTVSAVDNGADSLSSETTVIILVMDVNDNQPVFSNIIVENTLDASDLHPDQFVMHVEVADADSGRNAEVNLSISSPNSKWFKFESSGFLQLSKTDITAGSYYINITATDNGNPPLSSSKSVELVVHNNLTGQSNVQLMTISLPEGNYSGEIVGSVSEAIDGNQTTYRVSSSPSDVFVVNETSGEITCNGTVDRETKEQYLLLVNISYTEGGVEMTRRVLVILNILDGNDNFPQFVGGSVQWNVIPENAINNTFVQALRVTDLDSGQNGVAGLHYSIINTNTPFAVDSTTGDLTTRWELDRETQDSYLVRVQVRDGGTPPKSATANITISLIDVNDNSPSFTQNLYVFNVTENTTVGTPVSENISASDPDFAQNGTVSFVMDTDPNLCPFSLETERNNPSSTGVLKLNAQLDFETTSTYQCNVSAVDDMGCVDGCPYQRRTNATIRIVVLDINDEKPVFQGAPYTANVTREAGPGFVITDAISATDKDTDYGNNNVSYKILVYQEFFTINGSTGVLTVGGDLTQLQEDKVQIQVVASDNPAEDQPLSATTSIEIVIVDTNNRPWFQNGPYTVDITEEEITSAPWDYRALDTIDGKNVTCNCTYTIIPSEFSTFFTINEAGLVSQVQAIDREKTGSSIYLEVNATDSEIPRKSVTAGLYIRVKDTDDNQPYFTQNLFEFSVNETIAVNAVIGQLDAVDEDEGENAVIVYSAIAMDTRLTLEKNGTIKVKKKLFTKNESKENITFAVTVKNDLKSTDAAEVRITINPYDPNIAPSFDKDIFEAEIQFLSPEGTSIKVDNFMATDLNNDSLTYRIAAGNTRNIIDMDSKSGRMKLKYRLEESIGSVINLTVEATDDHIRPKTGSCVVLITVVGLEPTACIAERQLQIDSEQREIYLGLFIAMAVLLAVAFMATICTCYKWRAAKSKSDFYKSQFKDTGDAGKNAKSVQPEQYKGHAYSGLDVSKRAESNDYDRSAAMRDFSRQSVHNPGYVRHDADKRRCAPPPEPKPDYDEYSNLSPTINPNFLSRSMPVAPNYKPSVYLPTQSYRQDHF